MRSPPYPSTRVGVNPPVPDPPPMDLGGGGDAGLAMMNMNVNLAHPILNDQMDVVNPVVQLLGIDPGPNATDISPQHNFRLWKELLFIAESDPNEIGNGVRTGMLVKAHYVGKLVNGFIFDKNDETDSPFSFTFGEGAVIAGWERGLLGMKRREKVKLIIHPEFGYGDRVNGEIPANSTLIFEIEIVDYFPEDLTKKKNGSILRYNVLEGGSKYLNPNHGSLVYVLIRGKYKETVVFPEVIKRFRLGEGCEHGVPYGVEKALYKFRSGEGSILLIKGTKYAFSEYVQNNLPSDEQLEFYVELLSHENSKEPWQLEGREKLEISRCLKEMGNKFFAKSNFKVAFKKYKLMIDHLKAEALLTGFEEEERKKLLLAAYLNMSICNLKLQKPTMAVRNCDDALALDSKNTKALFRRGLANLAVNFPDPAKLDFEKVLELDPNNSAASQQLTICEKQIKENLKTEKQMCTMMFSAGGTSHKTESDLPNGMDNVSEWEQKPETNGNIAA